MSDYFEMREETDSEAMESKKQVMLALIRESERSKETMDITLMTVALLVVLAVSSILLMVGGI